MRAARRACNLRDELVGQRSAVENGDIFIVCGLGRLGRQCVTLLKEFGVAVVGVDRVAAALQDDGRENALDGAVIGDCGHADVLRKAGIARCRTILLVTSDERSNIAAAFTARSLNPLVRLIIRSAQNNLNALLHEQLGNLVAFEPSQFSAGAFALASLSNDTRALFEVGGVEARVARETVAEGDRRLGRPSFELNSAQRRYIGHATGPDAEQDFFFPFDAGRIVQVDDVLTFVESAPFSPDAASRRPDHPAAGGARRLREGLAAFAHWWKGMREAASAPKTALVSLAIMLALTLAGVLLYHLENPDISWFDAANIAIVLAIGGFDNVFGALKLPFPISPALYVFSVIVKIASTIFLGVVFATLTGAVLSARLQIARRRRSAPSGDHTIVVGMGAIGQKIAERLREWRQPLVGIDEAPVEAAILPDVAMHDGPLREALLRANIGSARAAIVVLDDEVENLEISLLAHKLNPACKVVFRTADQHLARNVASLVPSSIGISDLAIAAEAITGAAFGENILAAFNLDGRSVLVTEYTIIPEDTLHSRQIAEVAYGYGVAPILHRRDEERAFDPSDDIRLEIGDRLFVLATVDGLRRVEQGAWARPDHCLRIESCPNADAAFEAANIIARISGCPLAVARLAMGHLPVRLEAPLYQPQGLRLARELRKLIVVARLERAGACD